MLAALSPQISKKLALKGRLALSKCERTLPIESTDTIVCLRTDSLARRSLPLPVAMRIELDRMTGDRVTLRVAKDRRGLVTRPTPIDLDGLFARPAPIDLTGRGLRDVG